jgi:hypothetical protein
MGGRWSGRQDLKPTTPRSGRSSEIIEHFCKRLLFRAINDQLVRISFANGLGARLRQVASLSTLIIAALAMRVEKFWLDTDQNEVVPNQSDWDFD